MAEDMYVLVGHAGTRERARILAETVEGVYWADAEPGGDLIVVDPEGVMRLAKGGGMWVRDDDYEVHMADGSILHLTPVKAR
ncbi:hypothetical protein [Allonocardiopsis opalescens]|uniref:Uncharacterized protein n=1 Tax=Allonocardiopsis opalescens TaxID=1144618 RepID=A0A2T0PSZ2_9ACTN|nr:hypothetical protein [Allonocardiopsis opalescens]PRX92024.1 hypothetical protein CLV72_11297 [Allonocardiopsis opalescens]